LNAKPPSPLPIASFEWNHRIKKPPPPPSGNGKLTVLKQGPIGKGHRALEWHARTVSQAKSTAEKPTARCSRMCNIPNLYFCCFV